MAVANSMLPQIVAFKNVVKSGIIAPNLLLRISRHSNNVCQYSTAKPLPSTTNAKEPAIDSTKKMSKAMMAYLERAKAYDTFIKKERDDYLIGKRHLANMMGEDPEHFTQADVERAIEYLFPSGLYDKAARPVMKPPEEIFPPKKAAEFDETGRPFHSMFYTTRPNYFKALYEIVEALEALNKLEDSMIQKGVAPKPENQMNLSSSDWLTLDGVKNLLLEKVGDEEYEYFISTLQRLADHPYSNEYKDLIMKFRKIRRSVTQSLVFPELEYDSEGRPFITVPDCMRKNARGTVTVKGKGSGIITINGKTLINYFPNEQEREQIIFPLQFTGMMGVVDVEAEVRDGGPTGQSGCVRWGIAWALRSFVDLDMVEKMRIAGLLTRDWRRRERKKPGQEGARRKFTWKKR